MYPDGYGRVFTNGIAKRAHRVIYELVNGKIPSNLVINHICRVRACVNPEHLEATTHRDNILAGVGVAAINKRKTHCKWGHEFTPENTRNYVIGGKPRRGCRTCNRKSERIKHVA